MSTLLDMGSQFQAIVIVGDGAVPRELKAWQKVVSLVPSNKSSWRIHVHCPNHGWRPDVNLWTVERGLVWDDLDILGR